MYGTGARMKVKPGRVEQIMELTREFEAAQVPGWVGEYVYQMDADANEYYAAIIFESKEAYQANANRPEQDAFYRRFVELLEEEPEWHDGEIVYSSLKIARGDETWRVRDH
jgi:quinol monooxygenase YgiN